MEYLQNIVKDKKGTKNLPDKFLNKNNEDLEKQLYASLLFQVQKYFNLNKKSIKGKDRNSNKLNEIHEEINEIHEEKPNAEELENLEKDIIKLICAVPNFRKFYEENNTISFLKEFVKVFFISFCDFDNNCANPLFGKDTLQSLKKGDVEFFFEKDKNINIPDDRDLPFFLIPLIPNKDKQNPVKKDNPEEEGDTMPACDKDNKYYCFWSDKLIIARDKKKQNDISQSNKHKNEINDECNKINIEDSKDINADYDSFENLALFKKTFEVAGCGFFERADDERRNYLIPNIIEEVKKEREKKLKHLLSFIERIENFIEKFDFEIEDEKKKCQEKINEKKADFFKKKRDEIKAKYVLEIKDREETIAIAEKYKKNLEGELKGFENDIVQIVAEIGKVKDQIDKIKEDIRKKTQINIQGDVPKNTKQVSGGEIPEDDKKKIEMLEKKLDDLCGKKNFIENNSMWQVDLLVGRVDEKLINVLKGEKKELEDVLKENKDINFELYKERLASYSPYYYKVAGKKKKVEKKNWKTEDVLIVLEQLKKDINAVLESKGEYTIKSIKINIKDIIDPFHSYSFDPFVSNIERIIGGIISKCQIRDLYEYLCFGKETCKKVLVGSEQRFKGLQNLRNTCYINSILQNLVEFKDDLLLIRDLLPDEKSSSIAKTIHDTVFKVLGEKGSDPRIFLQNVLNISITNGFGRTGDPVEVYTSLMNYYINAQYRIEVVEGSEWEYFVYNKQLEKNDLPRCNAKLVLPGKYEEINDTDIINYLYNNGVFKEDIKGYIPVSEGPFVFKNTIIRKNCEECGKKGITIEIECSPYCMINIEEFIGEANNISKVVKETFDVGIEEEQMEGIECDDKNECKGKSAIVKRRCCYRVMNNCLCFNFVITNPLATNFIDIEDEVSIGDDEYESVCACYYRPGHYIAFKKINDIWFNFDDDDVFPIIDKSLPKMYGEYKPTLVFYKKKKKDKK